MQRTSTFLIPSIEMIQTILDYYSNRAFQIQFIQRISLGQA